MIRKLYNYIVSMFSSTEEVKFKDVEIGQYFMSMTDGKTYMKISQIHALEVKSEYNETETEANVPIKTKSGETVH